MNPIQYSPSHYQLPKEFIKEITTVHNRKGLFAVTSVWFVLLAIILVSRYAFQQYGLSWFMIPVAFLIAGRFGAFLQLAHEACHNSLFESKRWNFLAAKWLCSMPIGVFYEGYAEGHARHHSYVGTEKDPLSDREKYRICDFRNPALYLLFLKDLLGITALQIFFSYGETSTQKESLSIKLKKMAQLGSVQLIVILGLFEGNLVEYILFWILPAISAHMFLMRVRGIAEHGLSGQLHLQNRSPQEGTYYTRSFFTPQNHYRLTPLIWLERCLIGSFYVNFHHEHHLFPNVPYYHLAKLHQKIAPRVAEANPDVYAPGYIGAAIRNLLDTNPVGLGLNEV